MKLGDSFKRRPVVAVFGPDGSGKSTCIKLLARYLTTEGYRVRVVWVCSHHLLMWLAMQILARLGHNVVRPFGRRYPHPAYLRSSGGLNNRIWSMLEFLSLLVVWFLRVRLPQALGYIILVERYLAASIADLVYAMGWSIWDSFEVKFLLRLLARDSLLVFLDASYDTIARRRGINAEPYDYIKVQKATYWALTGSVDFLILDTSRIDIWKAYETIKKAACQRLHLHEIEA